MFVPARNPVWENIYQDPQYANYGNLDYDQWDRLGEIFSGDTFIYPDYPLDEVLLVWDSWKYANHYYGTNGPNPPDVSSSRPTCSSLKNTVSPYYCENVYLCEGRSLAYPSFCLNGELIQDSLGNNVLCDGYDKRRYTMRNQAFSNDLAVQFELIEDFCGQLKTTRRSFFLDHVFPAWRMQRINLKYQNEYEDLTPGDDVFEDWDNLFCSNRGTESEVSRIQRLYQTDGPGFMEHFQENTFEFELLSDSSVCMTVSHHDEFVAAWEFVFNTPSPSASPTTASPSHFPTTEPSSIPTFSEETVAQEDNNHVSISGLIIYPHPISRYRFPLILDIYFFVFRYTPSTHST